MSLILHTAVMMLGPSLDLHCLPLLEKIDMPAAPTESLTFMNNKTVIALNIFLSWWSEGDEEHNDERSDSSLVPDVSASQLARRGGYSVQEISGFLDSTNRKWGVEFEAYFSDLQPFSRSAALFLRETSVDRKTFPSQKVVEQSEEAYRDYSR